MTRYPDIFALLSLLFLVGCAGIESGSHNAGQPKNSTSSTAPSIQLLPKANSFYVGADLSYVNEMLDCGIKNDLRQRRDDR